MEEFNNNKFWIALGRCGAFTEDDKFVMRVWPNHPQYIKNHSCDLMPRYIKATNLDAAKRQAHLFIDKMFSDYIAVDKQHGNYVPPAPAAPPVAASLDCLTIGAAPVDGGVAMASDGLLNLKDLI